MPLAPDTIDAVVFDIGGVFLIPHPEPVVDWYARQGVTVSSDPDLYHRAHHRGVRAIVDGGAGGEHDSATWSQYDQAYFSLLGVTPPSESLRRWDYPLQPNIDAFARIAAGPRPVAVVSNNNGTAEQQLLDHGVAQVGPGELPSIVSVTDSTLVGVAKPDPAIFAPVLGELGFDPQRVLYVGDTVTADVRGATAAGMQVVQLDPFDDHADMDHERLEDLSALAQVLGKL